MPGIHFVCDFEEDLRDKESEVLRSMGPSIPSGNYKRQLLLKDKAYIVGCTMYDEYPMTSFEDDEFLFCLEGQIYGKSLPLRNKELSKIAGHLFSIKSNTRAQVLDWLLNTDGEFILLVLNKKSNEIVIMNDILGHLPLYYYKKASKLLVSRDLRFILNLMENSKLDKVAIAQHLMFCHTLGNKTLYKDIFRFEPATFLKVNLRKSEIELDNFYRFNFEEKKYSGLTMTENIRHLIMSFNEACKNRDRSVEGYKNILSLSGGLDSRSVAACLTNNNIPFCGVTFQYLQKKNADVEIAEQLSKLFNIQWRLFKLDPPKGKDILRLLRIKSGSNYLGMSFILPFFERVKEVYGSKVNFFTGDTGIAMRYNAPLKRLNDIDELANYILTSCNGKYTAVSDPVFRLSDVVKLVDISKSELIEELREKLMNYPERNMSQKYAHFLFEGYWTNWHYEGMDRNRSYFWLSAPLEATQFLLYALNCPDEQKAYEKLYRSFLLRLAPEASMINNARWNLPITSPKYTVNLFISAFFHRLSPKIQQSVRNVIRRSKKANGCRPSFVDCLKEQLHSCRSIGNYLSYSALDNVINDMNASEFANLFTITSCIEELECAESTISKYYELQG